MGTREVGRAGGPVGLRHQTGAADISFKNRTILPETQNVFWFFCCLFLFRISKDKLGENQVVKNRSVGQAEPLANEERCHPGVLEELAKPPSSSGILSSAAALLKP